MKFIHIADVHLGALPDAGKAYSKERGKELWETFAKVIQICEEEKVDFLFIAGDFFHRQPLKKELKEVNYYFSQLSQTRVILIAGNHDYVKSDSQYHNFPWNDNVYFLIEENPKCLVFEDVATSVTGFSYKNREIKEPKYDVIVPKKHAKYEVLIAHGGDEKHIPIKREYLEKVGFDYIALGHIHKPQILVENKAAYAGALEPIDRNDTGKHGYIKGEITRNGTKICFVPLAKREYKHFIFPIKRDMTNASIKEALIKIVEKYGQQNMYKFILRGTRDPEIELDTESMDVMGNILEVVDETIPDYDFEKLALQNQDNLIGAYIQAFEGCEEGSIEYEALCEGVHALMENRR